MTNKDKFISKVKALQEIGITKRTIELKSGLNFATINRILKDTHTMQDKTYNKLNKYYKACLVRLLKNDE